MHYVMTNLNFSCTCDYNVSLSQIYMKILKNSEHTSSIIGGIHP
jgi:hypothetical protein